MTQTILLVIDWISTVVGKLFAWSILILTFAIGYEVFSRYVFGQPTTWAYDVSYILYGTLFMMAGAYALSQNGHVRGDFLYRKFSPRRQAGMDLALYLLFFFPGMIALVYSGWQFFHLSWMINEHSSFSPEGPPIWPFKGLIPLAGALMVLQGLAEVTRCVICLRTGTWPRRLHDVEELEQRLIHDVEEKGAEAVAREVRA